MGGDNIWMEGQRMAMVALATPSMLLFKFFDKYLKIFVNK